MPDEKQEEAALDAYMDAAQCDGQGPTPAERLTFLKQRYDGVKAEYKSLMNLREEFKATDRKDALAKLRQSFEENYASRKWLVRELRVAGETVTDKFVAG